MRMVTLMKTIMMAIVIMIIVIRLGKLKDKRNEHDKHKLNDNRIDTDGVNANENENENDKVDDHDDDNDKHIEGYPMRVELVGYMTPSFQPFGARAQRRWQRRASRASAKMCSAGLGRNHCVLDHPRFIARGALLHIDGFPRRGAWCSRVVSDSTTLQSGV